MKFIIPKEISAEISIRKNFFLFDLIVVVIALILTFLLDSLVYLKLQIPYYIFSISSVVYLILKSKDNPGKRNYHSMYYALIRNKKTYHKINNMYKD